MDELERQRAGRAVAYRMRDLGATVAVVARAAHITPKALRAFITGKAELNRDVQRAVEQALDWPAGEIERHATGTNDESLASNFAELVRRAVGEHISDRNKPHGPDIS